MRNADDAIPALRTAARAEFENVVLCRGPVLHYQSSIGHGAGWSYDTVSTKALQRAIETAWNAGFDREGAAQLGRHLVDTRKWIGATEVYAMLTHQGIDVSIADVPFLGHSKKSCDRLWRFLLEYFSSDETAGSLGTSDRSPLMFQLSGHSVVIVGIARSKTGKERRVLVLDPAARLSWRNKTTSIALREFVLKKSTFDAVREAQLVFVNPGRITLSVHDQEERKTIIPQVIT